MRGSFPTVCRAAAGATTSKGKRATSRFGGAKRSATGRAAHLSKAPPGEGSGALFFVLLLAAAGYIIKTSRHVRFAARR